MLKIPWPCFEKNELSLDQKMAFNKNGLQWYDNTDVPHDSSIIITMMIVATLEGR